MTAAAGIQGEPSEGKVDCSVPWPLRGRGAPSLGGTWFRQFSQLTRQAPGCQKQTPSDPPAVSGEPALPVHGKLRRATGRAGKASSRGVMRAWRAQPPSSGPLPREGRPLTAAGARRPPTSEARVSLSPQRGPRHRRGRGLWRHKVQFQSRPRPSKKRNALPDGAGTGHPST